MYYIQNPTSNLKNALEELARKYGKEFNGDVDAFVEASKYASTNNGVDKYLEQVFDIVNGGGQPPIPTPVINVDDITGVSEDGVTNATTTVTITDGDGWGVAVTTDGTIVTAASINDGALTYTVAINSSTSRSGSITITLSRSGQEDVVKTISVTQNAYVAPTVTIGPVSEAPAAGGTFSTTVTITNGDGWIKMIQRDASVITAANIYGSTLSYTVAENTAYDARNTTITVVLSKANRTWVSDSKTITQEAAEQPLQNGVFIYYTDGSKSNYNVLDSGKTPVGVLLVTDNTSFIIHPSEGFTKQWSQDITTLIPGVTTTGDRATALLDMAGASNTVAVIASGLAGDAFTFATNAVYADGRTGFLPACGEMEAIRLNEANVNTAMNLINGIQLSFSSVRYWSSTQDSSENRAWYWRYQDGYWNPGNKNSYYYCRSVSAYYTDTPLQWIKFTQGGYVDTGKVFESGDRIQFTFDLSGSYGNTAGLIFGAFTKTSSIHRNRLTYNVASLANTYSDVVASNSSSGGVKFFGCQWGKETTSTVIDFDFSKTDKYGYTVGGSSESVINFSSSNRPSYDTEYSIYLNSYNINGKNAYEQIGLPSCDMKIYEYKVTDVNNNVKIYLKPVLHDGQPVFKDEVTGNYISISSASGFTPTITYAETE